MAIRESYSIVSKEKRGTAPGIVKLFMMLFFWCTFGFALGTWTFLMPVWSWVDFCRERGIREGTEAGGVVFLALLAAMFSMSLGLWATTSWVRSPRILTRLTLPLIALAIAYLAYSFWVDPRPVRGSFAEDVVVNSRFTLGAYPDEAKLRTLKEEGYTGVVSLLHPAVIPFEPVLIQREVDAVEALGFEFHHLPMLPWISSNKANLAELSELARAKGGRLYVHCYFGRDRVLAARAAIEDAAGGSKK